MTTTVADYVIIVAGGRGLRMGGEIPKQFLPVGGVPVLMRTLSVFREALPEADIILVLPAAQQAYWAQLCEEHHFAVPHRVATGGETRFHSVRNGLTLLPDGVDGVVGIHDGVRPFVSPEVIRRCYAEARERGSAVPVVPVVETMRQLTDSCDLSEADSRTVDRQTYRLVQTPQAFRISLFQT